MNIVHEPIFTCNIPTHDFMNFNEAKLISLPFSVHTQSAERAVHTVSQATTQVTNADRRDGFIKAVYANRKKCSQDYSKKDML